MKPTIWIFSLEPIETRYTAQWHDHFPKLLQEKKGDQFNIVQIDGIQKDTELTPGAFLNFSDTNYWKSSQFCNFLDHFNHNEVTSKDHFIFTDFWNPCIIQLKYMKELLGFDWKLHALLHAGSYDPQDFLGRLIGDAPWVRDAERSFFGAIDYNYFATDFHIDLFCDTFMDGWAKEACIKSGKITRSGWPMEYMKDTLTPYNHMIKRDLILFPHRIAPEKQVDIFRDLQKELPRYEFIVCQDERLTKQEYHKLLGEAKIVFSANLQETLGISCYEGALVDAIPMVPDRLSYSEMYSDCFKYPSEWTESFEAYSQHKQEICDAIDTHMQLYDTRLYAITRLTKSLTKNFFSCGDILKNL